jgi:hypothetical protein
LEVAAKLAENIAEEHEATARVAAVVGSDG